MARPLRLTPCRSCGMAGKHHARGYCDRCYQRIRSGSRQQIGITRKRCSECRKRFTIKRGNQVCCSNKCALRRQKRLSSGLRAIRRKRRKDNTRLHRVHKRYGITETQWLALYDLQKGKCPICDSRLVINGGTGFGASVDHCRKTGNVRGLLCWQCNTNKVGSNTLKTAMKMVDYLKKNFDARML